MIVTKLEVKSKKTIFKTIDQLTIIGLYITFAEELQSSINPFTFTEVKAKKLTKKAELFLFQLFSYSVVRMKLTV